METKLIIVGGTKGGPGKSTVAQQVAAGLQLKRGQKVHITDIDIQQTTTSWCE
ncbi:AAA family ATPase, partial [Enterobacter hormaechei]